MSRVLVTHPDVDRDEWLEARQAGIGASEIAAVMGISPYDSPFSLWWRKRNGWQIDTNAEMSTGTWLEPVIADWFAEHGDPNENLLIDRAGMYRHADREWQLATPDRLLWLVDSLDLVGLLECKWVAYSWDGWGAEDTDDIPVHYRAQALWQLDVMGLDEVILCALGPGGFRTYRVRRDEKDLVAMREAGRRFWQSLIDDCPPNPDEHAATLPILRRLHADIEDREQEIPAPVAEGWQRAKRFTALAKRVEAKYTAQLRDHLGTAKTAVLAGQKFAARTSNDTLRSSK